MVCRGRGVLGRGIRLEHHQTRFFVGVRRNLYVTGRRSGGYDVSGIGRECPFWRQGRSTERARIGTAISMGFLAMSLRCVE